MGLLLLSFRPPSGEQDVASHRSVPQLRADEVLRAGLTERTAGAVGAPSRRQRPSAVPVGQLRLVSARAVGVVVGVGASLCLISAACSQPADPPKRAKASGEAPKNGSPRTVGSRRQLPTPTNYGDACRLEPQVCASARGQLPRAIRRPWRPPGLRSGNACPTSAGRRVALPQFAGVALGAGPVKPLVVADGDLRRGRVDLNPVPTYGWFGFKTLWFIEKSYQGPVLIRGRRLDGTGQVAFGERPATAELLVPPIITVNSSNGVRTMPGSTWVLDRGCYAWQVDGSNFSTSIVFQARRT